MKNIKRIISYIAVFAVSLFIFGAFSEARNGVCCGTFYGANGEVYNSLEEYMAASNADWAAHGYKTVNDESEFYGTKSSNQQSPTSAPQQSTTQNTSASTGQTEKKTVKTCDHVYVDEIAKEPTCSEDGEMVSTCNKCGDSYKTKLEKTGKHEYEEKITKEASCTSDGEKTFTCKHCGESYTEPIPATGHDYEKSVSKQASCTEDGEVTYKCKYCGDTYTEPIPATGHTVTSTVTTKTPGLFTAGEAVTKCDVCGEILATEQLSSRYPITYLYALIVAVIAVIGIISGILISRKKVHKIA